MRKRAGIARALALDPELLFLDEPTAGLDPIGAAAFDQLILELRDALGLTVFLITHDLDTLYAICDRVAVLADKKVMAVGTIPELLALDHEWIQEYFKGPRGRAAGQHRERLKRPTPDGNPIEPGPRRQHHAGRCSPRWSLFIVWLSQVGDGGEKTYDIFFQQSVEGLAKGSSVTFSGVPVGQIEFDQPRAATARNSSACASRCSEDTPVLEGSTATIRGVGFTGVSPDPARPARKPRRASRAGRAARSRCPEQNPQSECPYGVPVIPTKPGALGQLLNTAPELLERVSTLTERLTELLSDRNQESIAGILDNLEEVSRSLAERSPEIAATLAEARVAIRQAGDAAERIGQLAGTTNSLLDRRRPAADQRPAPDAALAPSSSMAQLEGAIGDARPGIQAFSNQTLPEVGQLIRDLRATLRIAARDHRPAQPARRRRRHRRPAPARLRAGKKELTMRVKLLAAAAAGPRPRRPASAAARRAELLTLTAAADRGPPRSPRTAGQGEAITVVEPTVPQALRTTRIPSTSARPWSSI